MELSPFLAKFFGIYSIVLGLFWAARHEHMKSVVHDFFKNSALMMYTALLTLMVGVFVLMIHPVFEWNWRGFLTLVFGILPVIQGLLRLFMDHYEKRLYEGMAKGKAPIYWGVLFILIGIYLLASGVNATVSA